MRNAMTRHNQNNLPDRFIANKIIPLTACRDTPLFVLLPTTILSRGKYHFQIILTVDWSYFHV